MFELQRRAKRFLCFCLVCFLGVANVSITPANALLKQDPFPKESTREFYPDEATFQKLKELQRERILLILDAYRKLLPEEKRSKIDRLAVEIRQEKEVQAGVFRGQKMIVYDGILILMENENETAMLVAHEVGHVLENHYTKARISNALAAVAGVAAGAAIGGLIKNPYLSQTTAQLTYYGVSESFGNIFSQKYERTADKHAVAFAYAAGFDIPLGLGLWKKFLETMPQNTWRDYYGTHPPTKSRITAMMGQSQAYARHPPTFEIGGQGAEGTEVKLPPPSNEFQVRMKQLNAEIAVLKQRVNREKFLKELKAFYSKFPGKKRERNEKLTEEQDLAEVADVGLSAKKDGTSFDGKLPLREGSVSWYVKFNSQAFTPIERVNDPPKFKARWYAPDGELYQEKYFGFTHTVGNKLTTELQLDPKLGNYLVGRWRMEVLLNDMFLDERSFEVTNE